MVHVFRCSKVLRQVSKIMFPHFRLSRHLNRHQNTNSGHPFSLQVYNKSH
jgi:hypothetical protein